MRFLSILGSLAGLIYLIIFGYHYAFLYPDTSELIRIMIESLLMIYCSWSFDKLNEGTNERSGFENALSRLEVKVDKLEEKRK